MLFPNLQTLRLGSGLYCPSSTYPESLDYPHKHDGCDFESFQALRTLTLSGGWTTLNAILVDLFPDRHGVRHLTLVFEGLWKAIDCSLVSKFPHLQAANLKAIDPVRDDALCFDGLKHLLSSYTCLSELTVNPCFLTSEQLDKLSTSWSGLQKLSLIGQPAISYFIDPDFPELKTIDTSGKDIMGKASLDVLLKKCPQLQELTIGIDASDTSQFSQSKFAFPNLKVLTFEVSFLNYRTNGFKATDAARHISSFLREDASFVWCHDRPYVMDGEVSEEKFLRFQGPYTDFGEKFQSDVRLAVEVRAAERQRMNGSECITKT